MTPSWSSFAFLKRITEKNSERSVHEDNKNEVAILKFFCFVKTEKNRKKGCT